MVEVCRAVTRNDFVYKSHLFDSLVFERYDIDAVYRFERMPLHIEQSRSYQLGSHKPLVECSCGVYLPYQRVGYDLTRFVVFGIGLEYFGLESPVFVYLRGHLHKVARSIGAAHRTVVTSRQQAVQSVSKLVKHGLYLIGSEQRGLRGSRFGKVAHIYYNRANIFACYHLLIAEVVHPRTAAFAVARIIVCVQDTYQRPVCLVCNLKCLYFGIIDGSIFDWFEADTI